MLYAGCSRCGSVVPLWCSGRFMPHMPMAVEPSPVGPFCRLCGQMPPVFMCMVCGTVQGLYMPGMPLPAAAPGIGPAQLTAPVVQAPQGTPPSMASDLMRTFLKEILGGAGRQIGTDVGRQFGTWMS